CAFRRWTSSRSTRPAPATPLPAFWRPGSTAGSRSKRRCARRARPPLSPASRPARRPRCPTAPRSPRRSGDCGHSLAVGRVSKEGDIDVRRLQRVAVPGHRPRLYRDDAEAPLAVGGTAAKPAKIGVQWLVVLAVVWVVVAAGGIGLPHFEDRVGHRRAIAIEDA